jgi:spermidine synthase
MNWKIVFTGLTAGLIVGLLALWVVCQAAGAGGTVVRYDHESKYYRIRVLDYPGTGRRCLVFSKSRGIQSSMILGEPDKLDFRYSRSIMAALALHPAPKQVLLIGLGGGSIPRFIQKHFPDLKLDIVELDPDVVKVCQEFFQFKPAANTRVIVMDGRMYLKRSPQTYDVILLDAYAGDRVPFHLTTLEFLRLAKSRLNAGGLVASNLWEPATNRFYFAELKTYQTVFPKTYLFKCGNSGNFIVFGSLEKKVAAKDEWAKRAETLAAGKALGFDLAALVRSEYESLTDRDFAEDPLTDDKAPVDTLRRESPKGFEEGQPQ